MAFFRNELMGLGVGVLPTACDSDGTHTCEEQAATDSSDHQGVVAGTGDRKATPACGSAATSGTAAATAAA